MPKVDVESSPPTPSRAQAAMDSGRGRSRRGKLGIVDYGHDKVAMSPNPEEGEMDIIGYAIIGKHFACDISIGVKGKIGVTAAGQQSGEAEEEDMLRLSRNKRLRDECIVEHGEQACAKWIETHC